jgi:hypothetical protein
MPRYNLIIIFTLAHRVVAVQQACNPTNHLRMGDLDHIILKVWDQLQVSFIPRLIEEEDTRLIYVHSSNQYYYCKKACMVPFTRYTTP